MNYRNTLAEINMKSLEANFRALQSCLENPLMAPMVKADAYGHGDIQVARLFEKLGARFLGVVLIEEGLRLRNAGIKVPILVFGTFDAAGAEAILKNRLTPVLSTQEQIEKLKRSMGPNEKISVHLKFNTGMQRLGFEPEEAAGLSKKLEQSEKLRVEGVCTHFVSSDDFAEKNGKTAGQIELFSKICEVFKNHSGVLYHYLNSAAILNGLQPQLDVARPGIALYGANPNLKTKPKIGVKPVMTVKASLSFIHKVRKGQSVSYGGTWVAPKDSVVAVCSIGYADGIPRALSNKGRALVRGEFCPITGIVCMDYIMVDVTELSLRNKGPELGDEVVFLGAQKNNEIKAEEIAAHAATIPYEVFTGIQSRVPRVYIQ